MAIVSDQIDMMARTMTTPRATQFMEAHIPRRLKLEFIPSMKTSPSLLQTECDGEVVVHRHRLPVQCARFEFPSLHGFECLIGQSHRQRFENARFGDVAVAIDDRFDDDDAFDTRLAR